MSRLALETQVSRDGVKVALMRLGLLCKALQEGAA